ELVGRKGLDQVVVGTQLQTFNATSAPLAGGDQDHRDEAEARTALVRLDDAADLHAAEAGHLHVHDHEAGPVLTQGGQGLGPVGGLDDAVTAAGEALDHPATAA